MSLCSTAMRHSVHCFLVHLCSLYTRLVLLSLTSMSDLKCSIIDHRSHTLFQYSFSLKDNGIAAGTNPCREHSGEQRMYEWRRGW